MVQLGSLHGCQEWVNALVPIVEDGAANVQWHRNSRKRNWTDHGGKSAYERAVEEALAPTLRAICYGPKQGSDPYRSKAAHVRFCRAILPRCGRSYCG